MLILYFFSLAASAAVFGVFIREAFWSFGFVPTFGSGVLILLAGVLVYASAQLLFMAIMRFAEPTDAAGKFVTEILSFACVALLLPYIIHFPIDWPAEAVYRVEPLIYLAAFALPHAFFKLATFYASLKGRHGTRFSSIYWLGAACLAFGIGYFFFTRWSVAAEAGRPGVTTEPAPYASGEVYALARPVAEGADLKAEIRFTPGHALTYRLAPLADGSANVPTSAIAHVTIALQSNSGEIEYYRTAVRLRPEDWTDVPVPAESVPGGMVSATLRWTRTEDPKPYQWLNIRPIVYDVPEPGQTEQRQPPRILVSGPYTHIARAETGPPNIVVVLIDGLSSAHISGFGYKRETTGALDRLASRGEAYPNAESPSADVRDATAVLLGLPQNRPPNGGSITSRLHDGHYATGAFTEGAGVTQDLVFGSGIERDFEIFDQSYVAEADAKSDGDSSTPVASRATLDRALRWIEDHRFRTFFILIRLRELEEVALRKRYASSFIPETEEIREVDVYDAALAYLDRNIGSLLQYIRDREELRNTTVIVTSPYGHAFSVSADGRQLEEPDLHVPLIIAAQGAGPGVQTGSVKLESLAPTIAHLAGLPYRDMGAPVIGAKR